MTRLARTEADILVPGGGAMFDGHFPGHPMLPGARLLDLILAKIQPGPIQIVSVKFLSTVAPATRLVVQWSADEMGMISFDCWQPSASVASDSAGSPRLAASGKLRPL